jgi:hypothetical protein
MPPAVAAVFAGFPAPVRRRLLAVRQLIFEVARTTEGVGVLTETLKWGEPAYLTAATGSGSTIRLGWPKGSGAQCAVYFNCRTTLVGSFRAHFPDALDYQGSRAILLDSSGRLPKSALGICLAMALRYHRSSRTRR